MRQVDNTSAEAATTDVELGAGGALSGRLSAETMSSTRPAKVVLRQGPRVAGEGLVDAAGRFRISGLRGGAFQLQAVAADGTSQTFGVRLWTAGSAPPCANSAFVAEPAQLVVRGQRPFRAPKVSDAYIMGTIVVVAIAIPLIIVNIRHNQGSAS